MPHREHRYMSQLRQQLIDGRCSRREFLRTATLLGLSAASAYSFANQVVRIKGARAASDELPKGGTLKISMAVQELKDPHTYEWSQHNIAQQVIQFLTRTGHDNITRPLLAESWEVSDDLTQWTFRLRPEVTWRNGRRFTADDAIWNLRRILDPQTGSSGLGLMKSYMLNQVEKDGEKTTELWDVNAIERIDAHTFRLNLKGPQLAVPEHLFHYTMLMMDPEDDGSFGVGSNGTGPFELVEHTIGELAVLRSRSDYWGDQAHLDELRYIDLGEDPSAQIAALQSRQVHGLYQTDASQLDVLQQMEHVRIYDATTASTAVARMKVTQKPFDDPRVRNALKLSVDCQKVLDVAHRGLGLPGEHHHVCPIHPEYAELPKVQRDVSRARELLSEVGYPDGVDLEITCKTTPAWELDAVQAMVEQWREAGIRVKINNIPSAAFWDVWDKVPFGLTEWSHRPLGTMVLALAYRTGVPWNESDYSDPEFDRLLTEAEGTLDVEARREIMAKLERILQEDGPIVQPLWRARFTAYDKSVKGFTMHPTNYIFAEQLAIT
jgi:peptide/nickel transport system substrate-binding protein